jgi:hypothetical protein
MSIDIDKLHTTEMGEARIKRNLSLETDDVIAWCKQAVLAADKSVVIRKGKNWYVSHDNFTLTINAHSHTVITVHKREAAYE